MNRKAVRSYRWLIPILAIAAFVSMGWTESWDRIRSETAPIKTLKTSFVQQKHLKILVKPVRAEGVIYFSAPDSLRWEYRTPSPSVLMSHQGKTKRFYAKAGRWSVDSGANLQTMSFILDEIKRWLAGRFEDNPDFKAMLMPDQRIVLTAKSAGLSGMINRIELKLSKQPGMIESVMIVENEDSYTLIEFKDTEFNTPLPSSLFTEP